MDKIEFTKLMDWFNPNMHMLDDSGYYSSKYRPQFLQSGGIESRTRDAGKELFKLIIPVVGNDCEVALDFKKHELYVWINDFKTSRKEQLVGLLPGTRFLSISSPDHGKTTVKYDFSNIATYQKKVLYDFNNNSKFKLVTRNLEKLSGKNPAQNGSEYSQEIELAPDMNLSDELNKLVGLNDAKKTISAIVNSAKMNNYREQQGLEKFKGLRNHCVFLGNPGTGKTTVAKMFATVLYQNGVIRKPIFKEVDVSDLMGGDVFNTGKKTQKQIDNAQGGILFIDEAYTMLSENAFNDDLGKEIISRLLEATDDSKDDLIVILAGYPKEMQKLLDSNRGFESRFPNKVSFEDYSTEELVEIIRNMIFSGGSASVEDSKYLNDSLNEFITSNGLTRKPYFGNGRWCRNFYDGLINAQLSRLGRSSSESKMPSVNDLKEIKNVDIDEALKVMKKNIRRTVTDITADVISLDTDGNTKKKLSELIGLEKPKEEIKKVVDFTKYNKQRNENGLSKFSGFSNHCVFLGDPGTGKTTIAKLFGEEMYQNGVIPEPKLISTKAADLIAGYVGQTAIKTQRVIDSAIGGILFIDEAYALAGGDNSSNSDAFGKEAIAQLLTALEDHADDLIVILAGYTDPMKKLLRVNPGFGSRFPNKIVFDNYTVEELVEIIDAFFENDKKVEVEDRNFLNKSVKDFIVDYDIIQDKDFGNARWVRNLYQSIIRYQSVRIVDNNDITKDDLVKVKNEDITNALMSLKE